MSRLLSICIPSYNGKEHIGKLLDSLTLCDLPGYEVVVSDDCSVDGTWEYLQEYSRKDARLRVFRNDLNCGMDKNFARSGELAEGEYVWLCGQDDVIAPDGVAAVLRAIDCDAPPDFIHMTHVMLPDIATPLEWGSVTQGDGALGVGLKEFLDANEEKLPTFLPEYVIRRSLWRKVDVTRYFGTCYCQVGVFLEVSNEMKWRRISECYVTGLLPRNGWQADRERYANIILGHFVMLSRALQFNSSIGRDCIARQYYLHRRHLLYAALLIRVWKLESKIILLDEAQAALSLSPKVRRLFMVAMQMPSFICRIIWMILWLKRALSIRNIVPGAGASKVEQSN